MNIFNKDNRLTIRIFLIMMLSIPLSSCVTPAKTLKVRLITTKDINENAYYVSSPLVLHFYELKSNKVFNKADAKKLFLQEDDTLGDSLVHAKSYFIKPSMSYTFAMKFEDKSENLGIAAEFFKIAGKTTRWKYNISFKDEDTDIQLYIYKQQILSSKEYEAVKNGGKQSDLSKLKPPKIKQPKADIPKATNPLSGKGK